MSLDRERGSQIVRVGVQTRERDIGPICVLQSHGICAILIHPSIHPSILTHLTEREGGLALRDGRRVVHLADAVLAPALLEAQARVRGVRDDVAADGLGGVLGEAHAVGVGHDLVREHHGDAVLLIRCTRVSSRREQT